MMLRILSAEEVSLVAGGEEYYSDVNDFSDGSDYGGQDGGPGGGGQVAGPQDPGTEPSYDPSQNPYDYNYGNDPSNPYEQNSGNQGSSASGQTNSGIVDNSPSTGSPSAPPSIGSPNPSATYLPGASTGNGGTVQGGYYGSPTSPSGGAVQYTQKF